MGTDDQAEAVLLTGVFGVGKSTVAADTATILEAARVPYGALDLDWLAWTNANGSTRADFIDMMTRNLRVVAGNYRAAGARRLVLAGSIRDSDELDRVRVAAGMSLRSVELIVPLAEIERRLASDPTEERQQDLANSADWLADGAGTGFFDIAIDNDTAVRDASAKVLDWLGWLNT
jgi:adenylylsulfate kinase-like enzyme